MPSFDYMCDEVARLGRVQTFYSQGYGLTKEGSKFFETAWRKVPGYQGGFILDGGAHWAAALIHILGETNRPKKVAALSTLLRKHLAPVDTLSVVVQVESGVSGIFGYSAGIEHKAGPRVQFEVVCENGRVTFAPGDGTGVVTTAEAGKRLHLQRVRIEVK